jgi:hypothetical protein
LNLINPLPKTSTWIQSFLWRLVVYLHLAPAAFWWWMMPGGFPLSHPRFWANEVFPVVAVAVCLTCLWAERRGNERLRATTAVTIPAFWLSATVFSGVLFPYSAWRFLPPAILCLAIVSTIYWLSFRGQSNRRRLLVSAIIPAIASAVGVVWAQRGGEPDTLPANVALPQFEPNVDSRLVTVPVRLADHVTVQAGEGRLVIRHKIQRQSADAPKNEAPRQSSTDDPSVRSYSIDAEPLLSFESRSQDRFWTILSPQRYRTGRARRLKSLRHEKGVLTALYESDIPSVLHVSTSENNGETSIDAFTQLDIPIYSHLNSFVTFTISGIRKPALAFSPCPGLRVDVEPFDYPMGRPLRMAYVDEKDIFHVVQAKSGEKGPFAEFGSGNLPGKGALTLTLLDEGEPVCTITLDDWASQTGRSLSPTAGWSLPVNAIEFSQMGDASGGGPIAIWVTLAATSVGRGWDSVGHAAGTYRNRVRINWIRDD